MILEKRKLKISTISDDVVVCGKSNHLLVLIKRDLGRINNFAINFIIKVNIFL